MPKKKTKANKRQRIFRFIFLIGLLVLLYPMISDLYYRVDSNEEIADFDTEKKNLDQEDIDRRIGLARAYNDSLVNVVTQDPYDKKKQEEGRAEYARMLEIHEKIGHVEIPKINQDIPIYAGTSEEVLQKGVGHLEGTSLPVGGNNTHTVLTAHSGLPEKRLFTDLNQLKEGDKFYIHNIKEVMAYQVDQIKVIEPSNFDDLLVVSGHDYATLLTCTPIMINTHRLLVRGHRVPYVPAVDEPLIKDEKTNYIYKILFFVALLLIIILIITLIKQIRKNKNTEKRIKNLEDNIIKDKDKDNE
ncbi:MAG: class C sortase [Tissierellia bacterium]|nr:class C sortase [Tissierellia bacterium]